LRIGAGYIFFDKNTPKPNHIPATTPNIDIITDCHVSYQPLLHNIAFQPIMTYLFVPTGPKEKLHRRN
jgi:hypothetical protein